MMHVQDSDFSSLADLPIEILWRIAEVGSAESALSLSSTCRRFHYALYDPLLFRKILEYNQKNESTTRLGLELDEIVPFLGSDTAKWTRLVVADSKARELPTALCRSWSLTSEDETKILFRKIQKYAPCLVALKHPTILNCRVIDTLLHPFWLIYINKPSRRYMTPINEYETVLELLTPDLAFYLAATALEFPAYIGKRGTFPARLLGALADTVETNYLDEDDYGTAYSVNVAFIALSAWGSLLSEHIIEHCDESDPHLPNLSMIPWRETGDKPNLLPLPFQTRAPGTSDDAKSGATVDWSQWYSNRIAYMTDPAFLTEGEWCGYWSFDNDSISVAFAESIERMVLVVPAQRHVTRSVDSRMRIIATYLNPAHNFVLEGYMSPDGVFSLGPPGDGWVWKGRMTPFGMFGFWGSIDGSRIAGACWLWKSAWCKPAPQSTT